MKTIKRGDEVPWGLCLVVDGFDKWFVLKLPLWVTYKRKHYDIKTDEVQKGWYWFGFVVRVMALTGYAPIKVQRSEPLMKQHFKAF